MDNNQNNANVLEYGFYSDPLDEFFDSFDTDPELISLDEVTYQERAKNEILKIEVLDVDRYIRVNELKPITNPIFFAAGGMPTSDGLLSNEIFGITQRERAGIFAYIDLVEYFLDPSCYKTLTRLDNKFTFIISGMKKFKIDGNGALYEDANGGTGIKWLKGNMSKIRFKKTESRARDMRIKYIEHNMKIGRMFINKYIVIPPYYRDVNTSGKHTGVGQINTFYVALINACKSLKDNDNYGLSMADTTCARVQNTLKAIYDWFCGNNNSAIQDPGTGLGGKEGIISSTMNYTSDYASRLVLSAPELKRESINDLMVTLDKSAIPLAAVAADFFPFMIFHMRKFFENEFLNVTNYEILDKNGNQVILELENPMIAFNDDILKDQLKKFVYSHNNRFLPVKLPTKDKSRTFYMQFKGKRFEDIKDTKTNPEPTIHRPMTWVDVIYIAAIRSTENKKISITRYPYDSYFNTIYTGIEVASTKDTEPIVLDGIYYRWYPKIRIEDIDSPSASKFIDTMQISNLYLAGMGGDYDGDMVQVKGSFLKETNEELEDFVNSKANFINMGANNIRVSEKEAVQSLYNLTLCLRVDKDKLTEPEF